MGLPITPGAQWTVVILTCQNKNSAEAYHFELSMRQKKGMISEQTLILAVEDPKSHVGSGGATLNALLTVAEHLGARRGFNVVTSEIFQEERILIMHIGRDFPFDPCGRAFTTLPMNYYGGKDAEMLVCNIDLLLYQMTQKVAVNAPPGVWVCSTDMFIEIPQIIDASAFTGEDVCAISVPGTQEYASVHGVYKISDQGYCKDIIYRGSSEALQAVALEDSSVCLVTGIIYFSVKMTSQLLSFHTLPPLDACTYMGLDSGAEPLQLSLFFDFLLAMCEEITQDAFVTGERGGLYGTAQQVDSPRAADMRNARTLLWNELRWAKIKCLTVPKGRHSYMTFDAKDHHTHLTQNQMMQSPGAPFNWTQSAFSFAQETDVDEDCVLINSLIEAGVCVPRGTVVSHSHLSPGISLGRNNIILGLQPEDYKGTATCHLEDNIVLQSLSINIWSRNAWTSHKILVILGTQDDVVVPFSEGGTFCNTPWQEFLDSRNIRPEDVWPSDVPAADRCLFNAKIFPLAHIRKIITIHDILWFQSKNASADKDMWLGAWRLSLKDIFAMIDVSLHFQRRRENFLLVAEHHIRSTLLGRQATRLTSLFRAVCMDNLHERILETLDNVACECRDAGIAGRALANIADVLGCLADGQGGMRSGPAANTSWSTAFQFLEVGDIVSGVHALAVERKNWLDRPNMLIRAARHYEGAASILIRKAVSSAKQFMVTEPAEAGRPALGEWIIVECPARADLAGGWSDTPPITYEHGGAVFNVALKVDGKRPIGVRARRIPEPKLVLHLIGKGRHGRVLTLTELSQFSDYSQPHAPGSLLKAAMCCAGIVEFPSETSLADQLRHHFNSGFEMYSWSDLPHGSGLGTSSILAGAVIAALWKGSGRTFTIDSLIHAALYLEQLLTTGGGWQDQVGGLAGGFKVGHSKPELPLCIKYDSISISPETLQEFERRLLLVYTGTTRLARNLLQNVVRIWYSRDPEILATEDELVKLAWETAESLRIGNFEQLGACMDRYWSLKKRMAVGCEPASVTNMMERLRPHLYGMTMAGAGGGGFMYILTKEPDQHDFLEHHLEDLRGSEHFSIHACSVDHDGLVVRLEPPSDN